MRGPGKAERYRRPCTRRHLLGCAVACAAWTAACGGGGDAQRADSPPACLEGTRWEPRVSACVADAPDDDSLEALCDDEAPRPTRDIMGEVQDLERQRTALAADDPVRRDLARQLARGYDELGCATLREANEADSRRRKLKDEPDRAAYLDEVARRARKISDSARESAQRYRRELSERR